MLYDWRRISFAADDEAPSFSILILDFALISHLSISARHLREGCYLEQTTFANENFPTKFLLGQRRCWVQLAILLVAIELCLYLE